MDNRIARGLIFGGLGVIAAGLRFVYLGENTGGAGGLVIGLVMIAVGVCLLKQTGNFQKRLVSEGYCVDADFDSAEKSIFNTRANRNIYGVENYTVKCSYRDPSSGAVRNFTSEQIRLHFDPSFELSHRKSIKVYIDRNDPSQYYVDLDFLKELDKRRM